MIYNLIESWLICKVQVEKYGASDSDNTYIRTE